MLYLAYGSNLNIEQMKIRCPNAKPAGKFLLPNYKLVFRSVADITKSEGDKVPIGVWKITEQCEKALDRYEGYPRLYRKEYLSIKANGEKTLCMFYQMNDESYEYPPQYSYFQTILDGYKNFKLDERFLFDAQKDCIHKSDDMFNSIYSITSR
tara:strand:+ start:12461 stop:12919 length:459 start_codon:yes stop_codon:yes gene_type:complete